MSLLARNPASLPWGALGISVQVTESAEAIAWRVQSHHSTAVGQTQSWLTTVEEEMQGEKKVQYPPHVYLLNIK